MNKVAEVIVRGKSRARNNRYQAAISYQKKLINAVIVSLLVIFASCSEETETNNVDDSVNSCQQQIDSCGVCGGDNSSCIGCDGIPNSGAELDLCNVCGGDSSSCSGCDGVPNSEAEFDYCGVCGGDGSSCIDRKLISEVIFLDDNLRKCVNNSAATYVDELTALSCTSYEGQEITSLQGIEELESLARLSLTWPMINDISPIFSLTNLKYLYIYKSPVESINGIEELSSLEELYLPYNKIYSIAPVLSLNELKVLQIRKNCLSTGPYANTHNSIIELEQNGVQIDDYLDQNLTECNADTTPPIVNSFYAETIDNEVSLDWDIFLPTDYDLGCFFFSDYSIYGGYDQEFDYSVSNCSLTGNETLTYAYDGKYSPTVVFSNGRGSNVVKSANATIISDGDDVAIRKVELAQSVIKEGLKLVPNKPAKMIVHVTSVGDIQNAVDISTVIAKVYNYDTLLDAVILDKPVDISEVWNPLSFDNAFTTQLKPEWVNPGLNIKINLQLDGDDIDSKLANNEYFLEPEVTATPMVLPVTIIPIEVGGITATLHPDFSSSMVNMWPISAIDVEMHETHAFSEDVITNENISLALQQIAELRLQEGSDNYYLGILPEQRISGSSYGRATIGSPQAVSVGQALSTLLHELGHNFGLRHVNCGDPANFDITYPYKTDEIGIRGYDAINERLLIPTEYSDIMSYCHPKWISDYHYQKAAIKIEERIISNQVQQIKKLLSVKEPQKDKSLLISGNIDLRNKKITLKPLVTIHHKERLPQEGEFVLSIAHENGIDEYLFSPNKTSDLSSESQFFVFSTPHVSNVKSIAITKQGLLYYSQKFIQE